VPRIRTIKPDAFTSESLSSVSVLARWTFAGLWTYLDDAGLGRADTRLIKAALFPLDAVTTTDDVDGAVNELIDAGCIHTYMSGGKVYVHAPEFLRHQRINRPTKSVLPPCSCQSRDQNAGTHGPLSEDSVSAHPHVLPEGKGREGERNGNGGGSADAPPPTTRPPRKCQKHLNDPDPPACRACGDARRAHDSWQKPTLSAKTTMCADHPESPALNCPGCKATTKTDTDALANIRAELKRRTA